MFESFGKSAETLLQFVDLIKSNLLSISLSLAIFSWLILLLPDPLFSYFNLVNLRNNYNALIGAIALISSFLTIILILYRFLALFYLFIRGNYFEISRLTPDECSRLNHFISNKSLTATFNTTDGVVYMLQDKGLIYQARSDMVKEHYEQDFHMYRWIYLKLLKNPELVLCKLENEKENQNEHE